MKKWFGMFLVVVLLSLFGAQAWTSSIVWIDVRSASEYQRGHLSQAVNIPHTEIGEGITALSTVLSIEKDTEIKLYCGSGRRAGIALKVLEDMGYTHVSNEGGYKELLGSKASTQTGSYEDTEK
jgi:phage shock protein E